VQSSCPDTDFIAKSSTPPDGAMPLMDGAMAMYRDRSGDPTSYFGPG
jgi:hypothetical protein